MHDAFFVHFFAARPWTTATWNDQILRILEEESGKAVNSTISVWTRVRPPLFSSNINSLLLSNWATCDNCETVWKDAECRFRKVPIIFSKGALLTWAWAFSGLIYRSFTSQFYIYTSTISSLSSRLIKWRTSLWTFAPLSPQWKSSRWNSIHM